MTSFRLARTPSRFLLMAALFALAAGCDSSSDDGGGTPDTVGPTPDTVVVLDGTGDGTVEMGTFHGKLIDFQTHDPIDGATLVVIDNRDGKTEITSLTSAAGGIVTFQVQKGIKLGFKVTKGPAMQDYVPTYQFDIASDYGTEAEPETLWLVNMTTFAVAPGMAGITIQAGLGNAAGAVYLRDAQNAEVPVGCSLVASDPPSNDTRYFGNSGLPSSIDIQPSINPKNGYFLAANVPADATGEPLSTVVKATVGGTEIGSVRIFTYPDSICIANIYQGFFWDDATSQLTGADVHSCPTGAVCDENGTCP